MCREVKAIESRTIYVLRPLNSHTGLNYTVFGHSRLVQEDNMPTPKVLFALGLALAVHYGRNSALAQSLYTLPDGIETRWASPENPQGEKGKGARTNGGRKGRPAIPIKAGEQVTLAEVRDSSGTIRRIWGTISDRSPAMLRGLKIEMFWDGATKPAVSVPFGDFFGFGLGHMVAFQSALFASPEGRSFNCYVPMPFSKGMKIVLTNESGKDLQLLFYDVDYTLGDKHDANDLYFHAHYRRENPTKLQRDFEILPRVSGKGSQVRKKGGAWGRRGNRLHTDSVPISERRSLPNAARTFHYRNLRNFSYIGSC